MNTTPCGLERIKHLQRAWDNWETGPGSRYKDTAFGLSWLFPILETPEADVNLRAYAAVATRPAREMEQMINRLDFGLFSQSDRVTSSSELE
jgi:hypothetical protein